jgi:hypothetical protein
MAVNDTREPSRNYPIPFAGGEATPSNNLDDDMKRVGLALAAIGIDIKTLIQGLATRADIDHVHAMAAIVGLVDALAGKADRTHAHALNDLSDVDVSGVTAYQVLAYIAGKFVPWTVDLGHVSGNGMLRVDQPQALSTGEQAQGRTNLGAAPLASPHFTGQPTGPTPAITADSDQFVTVTALRQAIANLVGAAPGAVDTIGELAAALGNDANFSATVLNLIAGKADQSALATKADKTDLAAKADKDNPAFTGVVQAPTFKTAGTDARATGVKLADGTDLGEVLRVTQSYDDTVANCGGNIPAGNCNGNTKWTPPDGNWWNWVGVTGISRANPSGYPAPSTFTNAPITVALVYGNYAVTRDEIGGLEQHRNVNNCNCGAFNCYTNCAANCNCNCSSCCFLPGAKVLLADGSLKRIMDVRIGDRVRGRWGVNTVKALTRPLLGHRTMIVVNETLWNTTDHPMWTRQGWKLVDKDYWLAHDVGPAKELFGNDGESLGFFDHPGLDPDDVGIITIGMDMATPGGFTALTSLRFDPTVPPEQQLYGLVLDGDHIYYVDGYAVGGWAERDIDYRGRIGL